MFDDIKTYGIVGILLILIMGYFVYINYRDNMILKNDIKEIKEFFYNGEQHVEDEDEDDYDEDDYDEYEDQYTEEPQLVFEDVDEYFSHVKSAQLPVIEELPEEEPVMSEEKIKKKKPRKSKKVPEVIPIDDVEQQETVQE